MARLASAALFLLLVGFLTLPAAAQGSAAGAGADLPSGPPEVVADAAQRAILAGDLDTFAALMDPAALEEFRGMMMEVVDAVAEVEEADGENASMGEMFEVFFGGAATEDLAAMDAREFFHTFFASVMDSIPGFADALAAAEFETVGHVLEGDDLAHVVSRTSASVMGLDVTQMSVTSLRRGEEGWRMLLSGQIEGMGQMIRMQVLGADAAGAEDAAPSGAEDAAEDEG